MNLRPIDFTHKRFWRGTYDRFGFRSWITLVSPLANTILNWKYRNYDLEIDEQHVESRAAKRRVT